MTGRRVPWWVWLLVAVPWLGGLVSAAVIIIADAADRKLTVTAPATVVAILIGSLMTVVGVALVVGSRHVWTADEPPAEGRAPVDSAPPRRLLERFDDELAGRLATAYDLLGSVRAAAERGVLATADVAALRSAQAQIEGLSALVAELQTLTDLSGRWAEPAPVDLGPVVTDVLALVAASPGLGGRHLADPDVATTVAVLGDRDLLRMALHKIVLNAITYSRPGDTIALRATDDGAEVVVEVSDTGLGIPADELSLAPAGPNPDSSGHGIRGAGFGLMLAWVAVERQGGAVRVRSREGLGTVVTVALPAARPGR